MKKALTAILLVALLLVQSVTVPTVLAEPESEGDTVQTQDETETTQTQETTGDGADAAVRQV